MTGKGSVADSMAGLNDTFLRGNLGRLDKNTHREAPIDRWLGREEESWDGSSLQVADDIEGDGQVVRVVLQLLADCGRSCCSSVVCCVLIVPFGGNRRHVKNYNIFGIVFELETYFIRRIGGEEIER